MLLITGSNGQLGSELKKFYNNNEATFVDVDKLDITDLKAVTATVSDNIKCVINCAAYTAVDKAEEEQDICFKVNTDGVKNLAKVCSDKNIPLIHISTDYVFDGTNHIPYKESDTTNPQSIYGESKAKSEKSFMQYAKTGVILRTSWIYSEYGNNFVKTMINLGNNKDKLNVVFDQIGTPTYAYDLAKAIYEIIALIEKDEKEIYNFSNEGIASWYDFALEIIDQKNINCDVSPIETKDYPTPAKRPHYSVLNKAKIKNRFSISIRHWKEALKECLTNLS
ncbi:MAG: dTDP-4-dehydrorhamnose reductase [Alphaproteobacteria bacterium]|nr:dTDP-4-dehydrorhamnose reductase [Alphaproteobacteria bacterium]